MGALQELADRTPASRERYVDLLRAIAICTVVLGHWLVSYVAYEDQGRLTGHSALPFLPWAFPITWSVQVMPLFFIVGGYANTASLASHQRRGGTAITWLQDRSGRLVRPTTALLLILASGALVASAAHADRGFTRLVVWVASIPLWFLSAYFAMVVAAPVMIRLHRRFGWWVLVVLVVLVALGDLARFSGRGIAGAGNFVFGWLAIHQLGIAWRHGRLPFRPGAGWPLAAGGLAALFLLTVPGPYPISVIDIPGQRLLNASPPTLALLATTAFQLGLVVLLRDPAHQWLQRARPWRGVVAVNAVVFTVFLWHMSAVVLLVGLLSAIHRLPTPVVATADWWLWRAPWLLMLSAVLAVLVAIFDRIELKPRTATAPPAWVAHAVAGPARGAILTVASYANVVAGLLSNNLAPNSAPYVLGMPAAGLVAYLVGAAMLRLLRGVPMPGRAFGAR